MLLHNEFATVVAEPDLSGRSPRLRLVDVRTGVSGLLDPIVLEALAWASHEELEDFTAAVLARSSRLG